MSWGITLTQFWCIFTGRVEILKVGHGSSRIGSRLVWSTFENLVTLAISSYSFECYGVIIGNSIVLVYLGHVVSREK